MEERLLGTLRGSPDQGCGQGGWALRLLQLRGIGVGRHCPGPGGEALPPALRAGRGSSLGDEQFQFLERVLLRTPVGATIYRWLSTHASWASVLCIHSLDIRWQAVLSVFPPGCSIQACSPPGLLCACRASPPFWIPRGVMAGHTAEGPGFRAPAPGGRVHRGHLWARLMPLWQHMAFQKGLGCESSAFVEKVTCNLLRCDSAVACYSQQVTWAWKLRSGHPKPITALPSKLLKKGQMRNCSVPL